MRLPIATLIVLLFGAVGASAQTAAAAGTDDNQSLNLSAYAELLRSDVRTLKVAVLTEVVGFTEAEDKAFWPVYRECDQEASKLGDERVTLIREYAAKFSALTDEVATTLARRAIELEAKRHAAKTRCYEKVSAVMAPRTALRFLQVEHQLQLLIDLQIAASLPVAPAEPLTAQAPARKDGR